MHAQPAHITRARTPSAALLVLPLQSVAHPIIPSKAIVAVNKNSVLFLDVKTKVAGMDRVEHTDNGYSSSDISRCRAHPQLYCFMDEPVQPPSVPQMVLLSIGYSEIVSTRKLRSHTGKQFLDIKCGNLMKHRVIRCETPFVSQTAAILPPAVRNGMQVPSQMLHCNTSYLYCSAGPGHFCADWYVRERKPAELTHLCKRI